MLKLKTTKQMVRYFKALLNRYHMSCINHSEQYVLVPTPEAMAFNLHHFKSLVDNPKFSTIVTNITVDGLDEMKKTSKEARDATR